ncbi:MAG: hypothetical protein OHK0017_10050 [Patescibacteria group bacterium]
MKLVLWATRIGIIGICSLALTFLFVGKVLAKDAQKCPSQLEGACEPIPEDSRPVASS